VPTKLYLPMVSDVAALSNRNPSFELDLAIVCQSTTSISPISMSPISLSPEYVRDESRTHFAETLRYMLDGVKNSAGMDEKTGTRLGGLGELTAAAKTSRTVSSDGWTTSCRMVSDGLLGTLSRAQRNVPEAPCC
jgi:hypothetical protein